MKEISCYIFLIVLFLIACQEVKEQEENPSPPKVEKKKIDFDHQVLNYSVWTGTRASDGHLIYMKLDSSTLWLLEVDTTNKEYIETASFLDYELTDTSCLIANYPLEWEGGDIGLSLLYGYFLNDHLEDSLLRDVVDSKESEYKSIKEKYFPMHFINNVVGVLNPAILDEINFKNADGAVIVSMKKDTFYSKHAGTFFKNIKAKKGRGLTSMEYSFTTDSSYNTYYCTISKTKDRESKYAYYRERLKGEKKIKWVGDLLTTYTRDLLIVEYQRYRGDNKRPVFLKIMPLDTSLYKYPIGGRY